MVTVTGLPAPPPPPRPPPPPPKALLEPETQAFCSARGSENFAPMPLRSPVTEWHLEQAAAN